MSIVEVLKSVEVLAKAVHEKSKHLDELIAQYNTKILLVNKFLDKLPTDCEINKLLTEEQFIDSINHPQCPKCQATIDDEFLIIPKRKVAVENDAENESKVSKSTNVPHDELSTSSPEHISSYLPNKSTTSQHKYQEKSKKVCSYCKRTGHSRARCFKRLNGEKPI